jgi:hypothetical protein
MEEFMKVTITAIYCLICISILTSACSTLETPTDSTLPSETMIVCEVFYRPSSGASMETAPLITFVGGNEQKSHQFERMAFAAYFQDDDYEGVALSIAILDRESGDEIFRQLYQFDPQNPVKNQFIGGHGFTGLNYVFQPGSSAEIQYFCSIK